METLFVFFANFRWQDIIDIGLNSYILFRLYVLFRGTNVFRVLIGIGLLWFFQRVASSLGLIVTSWIIQGITAVAALIIIIIFRNEIRRVLQARNIKSILWGLGFRRTTTPTEIIAESVFELSQNSCGALIVLPATQDIREVTQNGTPWHGNISKEMIKSVFWPDNPVHDGAAIIEGKRVSEVSVILPLSKQKDLPSHYSTRHRAALGLSEQTDALSIVVSEERGTVSIAKKSKLYEIDDKIKLNRLLQDHVGIANPESDSVKREKLELAAAALISFIFICGVWISFSQGLYTLTTIKIPIEYMNRNPNMEITETTTNSALLHLSGSGALIKSIRPEQVRVRLDLSKAVEGSNRFSISETNVTLPPGIVLKKVEPANVDVSLDVRIRKKVPVQVDWKGSLPQQLILTQVNLSPDTVTIVGEQTKIKSVATIYTEPVSLDKLVQSGEKLVKLVQELDKYQISDESKRKIRIIFTIENRYTETPGTTE